MLEKNDQSSQPTLEHFREEYFKALERILELEKELKEREDEITKTIKVNWDWWGFLVNRIPHLSTNGSYKFWIVQCIKELMTRVEPKESDAVDFINWLLKNKFTYTIQAYGDQRSFNLHQIGKSVKYTASEAYELFQISLKEKKK